MWSIYTLIFKSDRSLLCIMNNNSLLATSARVYTDRILLFLLFSSFHFFFMQKLHARTLFDSICCVCVCVCKYICIQNNHDLYIWIVCAKYSVFLFCFVCVCMCATMCNSRRSHYYTHISDKFHTVYWLICLINFCFC